MALRQAVFLEANLERADCIDDCFEAAQPCEWCAESCRDVAAA